jgi:hypothetical protein
MKKIESVSRYSQFYNLIFKSRQVNSINIGIFLQFDLVAFFNLFMF